MNTNRFIDNTGSRFLQSWISITLPLAAIDVITKLHITYFFLFICSVTFTISICYATYVTWDDRLKPAILQTTEVSHSILHITYFFLFIYPTSFTITKCYATLDTWDAQINPASSRATAVTAVFLCFPLNTNFTYFLYRRFNALSAISIIPAEHPSRRFSRRLPGRSFFV